MNLILDLDGTLITDIYNPFMNVRIPYSRPYLKEFLSYVFSKFQNVGIWTNANNEWYYCVYNQILSKYLPEGKQFSFVYVRRNECLEPRPKPLTRIYEMYPNIYNNKNTYIIDDSPFTYMYNVENAIHINTYNIYNAGTDCDLLHMIRYLEQHFFS